MPGWTSLATVQSVHGWLEAGALFFFAALVVFELLAHRRTENGKRFEKIALACFAVTIFMEVLATRMAEGTMNWPARESLNGTNAPLQTIKKLLA